MENMEMDMHKILMYALIGAKHNKEKNIEMLSSDSDAMPQEQKDVLVTITNQIENDIEDIQAMLHPRLD